MPRVTPDSDLSRTQAIAAVPAGRWAVAVSGGADSVALLLLLRDRQDLQLYVVHLDHETREGASREDAQFVRSLCERLGIACTVEMRSSVESKIPHIAANLSARFRAARFALFRRVVREHQLAGVILAHHADDQAETVFHRLARGAGVTGLTGMSPRAVFGGDDPLVVLRPLLQVKREELRHELIRRGEPWREDASNASDAYTRNRIRVALNARPGVSDALRRVADACAGLRQWVEENTPVPAEQLPTRDVLSLPTPLRRELVRRWLVRAGLSRDRIDSTIIRRLIDMAEDASTAPRQQFPNGISVRRKRGILAAHSAQK